MIKKKKIRQKHQSDPNEDVPNSSDDENVPDSSSKSCAHISKSISIVTLKKLFKNKSSFSQCQLCLKNPKTSELNPEELQYDESVWLCLQCGNQGCSQQSKFKHALQHFNTPHSDSHAISLNTTTWAIWCYKCDEEITELSRQLAECVELVKKQAAIINKAKISSPSSSSCFGNKTTEENPKAVTEVSKAETTKISSTELLVVVVTTTAAEKKKNGLIASPQQIQVPGLKNLVNTCFFNAVLQNLSQVPCLLKALEEHCLPEAPWEVSVPTELKPDYETDSVYIPLPNSGSLTMALIGLLKDMNPTTNDKKIINPMTLFNQVCEIAPQFKSQQQQDSHELLRCLLDGVRTEEIKRQKRGFLSMFGLTEKSNPKNVEEEVKSKLKAFGKNVAYTVVDKVFGGQLVSTVFCEECRMSSQVFESFMDLSLPVTEEKRMRPGLQKKQSEDGMDCFGRTPTPKRSDAGLSKYQEKKIKQQKKKDAKKQIKAEKNAKLVIPLTSSSMTDSTGSIGKSEENSEEGGDADVNDADIEDNNDDTTSLESITAPTTETTAKNLATASEGDSATDVSLTSEITLVGSDQDDTELSNAVAELSIAAQSVVCESQDSLLDGVSVTSPSIEVSKDANYLGSTDSGFGIGDADVVPAKNVKQEWLSKSWTSMAPRYISSSHECSVLSCLNLFTLPELLMGKNKFGCERCSRLKAEKEGIVNDEDKIPMVYTNATKQLLIFSPPAVLTLHLKRFQQSGMSLTKVNRFVEFPLVLDLAPFCSSIALGLPHMRTGQNKILYSLCGVVEHSGKLTGGHYTAFVRVKNPPTLLNFLNNTGPISQNEVNVLLEEFMKKCKFPPTNSDCNSKSDEPVAEDIAEPTGKWYHISDTHVSQVNETTVLKCQAYLLFYERIF